MFFIRVFYDLLNRRSRRMWLMMLRVSPTAWRNIGRRSNHRLSWISLRELRWLPKDGIQIRVLISGFRLRNMV